MDNMTKLKEMTALLKEYHSGMLYDTKEADGETPGKICAVLRGNAVEVAYH
jgi:hypothetical protein